MGLVGAALKSQDWPTGPAEAHGPLRRLIRNSTLNLLAFGFGGVCTVVVVFTLARGLGKEGLGQYYTIYALVVLVQLITEAGVATILTRRLARAPAAWKETVGEAAGLLVLAILASTVCLLALGYVWVAWQKDPSGPTLFALAALVCAGMHAQRFGAGVFQAFEQFGYENVGRIFQSALFMGGLLLLLPRTGGLLTALAVLAASHLAEALFLGINLQWKHRCLRWRCSPALVRGWLSEAVPLGLADLLRRATWQTDTLLLGFLQPLAVVGVYSVAYRPLGPLNWVPQAILVAAFPSFARLAEEDRPGLSRAFQASIRLLWIISLPLAVGIGVCAEPIVLLLAGPEFLGAVPLLRLLIGITCLSYLSYQFRFLLTAVGQRRAYLRLVLLVLALEVGVEAALIPWWGALGAATGSVLGELVFTFVGLLLCRRLGLGKIEWKPMAAALLPAAVMGVLLWMVRDAALPLLVLAGAFTFILYLALCVWIGALRVEEMHRFLDTFTHVFRGRQMAAPAGRGGSCS
jgi:O-antigen/teichoic acid export membrane protein